MPFQLDWPSSVDTLEAAVITMNGGAAACRNGLLTVTCGTKPYSGAGMQSKFPLMVNGRESVSCIFTAMFDPNPQPGTMQFAGLGDGEHGIFAGFNGTEFGIRLLMNGCLQFYSLTISGPATAAGTLSVIINGMSLSYNLSSGQSVASILWMIANDPSLATYNLQAKVVNNTVLINTALAQPNLSSPLTSDGGTGCGPILTQVVAGQSPVDQWAYATEWNGPGFNPSTPISWSCGNTFRIDVVSLGFGSIKVSVLNPESLQYTVIHTFSKINTQQGFSFVGTGLVPSVYACNFTGGPSLSVGSSGFLVSGADETSVARPHFSATLMGVSLKLSNQPTTAFHLQNMVVSNSVRNCSIVRLNRLTVTANPNCPVIVSLWKDVHYNGVMNGTPPDDNSCVLVDTVTSTTIVPGTGTLLRTLALMQNTPIAKDFMMDDVRVEPGSTIDFCIQTPSSSLCTLDIGLMLTWNQP